MALSKSTIRTLSTLAFTLLMAGVGYGVGTVAAKYLKANGGLTAIDRNWLWLLPVVMLAVVLLHEGGHALAGRLVNFRLLMLTAGPLRWDRNPDGIKLSFNRQFSLWGGICASVADPDLPPGLADLRQRMFWMVAGGPLASLVGGLAGLGLAWMIEAGGPRLVLASFGLANFAIAIVTAIPQRIGGFVSDGQRLMEFRKESPAAERYCAVATLSSLSVKIRPRDWPHDIVEMATRLRDETYDALSAAWLRYGYHADRRELEEAKVWLELMLKNVESWPEAFQPIVYSSAAYHYAIEEPNVELAEKYFALSNSSPVIPPEAKALNEAALALVRGDSKVAREAADRGRQIAARKNGTASEALLEHFDLIEARAAR